MKLLSPQSRFRLYGSPSNYLSVAKDVALGRLRGGAAVSELQEELQGRLAVRAAVCMPQARMGIYLTLRALIKPGQKVVLSPYTIHDVVNMVLLAGARPVFADIDRATCNIDPAQVSELIDRDTGAVFITHLHGLACDVESIRTICDKAAVPLVEDCAQAFGSRVDGKGVGTFGRAGIFSFGIAKNINSFYGGLVITDDLDLAEKIRTSLSLYPLEATSKLLKRIAFCLVGDLLTAPMVFQGATFRLFRYGQLHEIEAITKRWRGEDAPVRKDALPEAYKRRMTPMQARLVLRLLDDVERDTETRVGYAGIYDDGLSGIPGIIRPPLRKDGSHIYLTYPIQVPDRMDLLNYLMRLGRDVAIQHMGNNADYECFREFARDCPNARATASQVLLLPCYPSYGRGEVEKNVALIRRYFGA